ncbi:MAG: arginine--tRNA ligase [Candidatus Jordarchaeales archaeon]|nr:arginine--tRNA ligase [Candidatus Jordarchaeia archaeon]
MVTIMILTVKAKIADALWHTLKKLGFSVSRDDVSELPEPPDPRLGDISSAIPLKLARSLKRKPLEIAQSIALNFEKPEFVERVEAAEPGYVNFFLDKVKLAGDVIRTVMEEGDRYGFSNVGGKRKVIVEHTAVNPTKPLHIGHLRNAVLGDVVANLLRACGWRVEVQNYIDDLGRQMGVLVWAFLNNLHLEVPRERDMKLDFWYGLVYAKAAQKLKENPELEAEVDEVMKRMLNEDEVALFSRKLAEMCVESNLETAARAGITYDLLVWESDISKAHLWEHAMNLLEKSEHFVWETEGEYKGCFVAKLSHLEEFKDKKNPDKVLVRSNMVPTYVAHDIAYQLWKFGILETGMKYRPWHRQFNGKELWTTSPILATPSNNFAKADVVINVVGYEQEYLQKTVKVCLKLLGHLEQAENSIHLSYKHVQLMGEKFSGREGNWVGYHADAVINQTLLCAYEQVSKNLPEASELEKRQIAEIVAVGAVRYWLTKFSTEQTIIFDYGKVTNFDGETGPYIQYAAVRAKSILEKAGETPSPEINPEKLLGSREIDLIKHIAKFPEVVQISARNLKPNILAEYTYQLAVRFNKFYEECPVLTVDDPETRKARLALVQAVLQSLKNAMKILGIEIPPKM